jgi:hypothetical protein
LGGIEIRDDRVRARAHVRKKAKQQLVIAVGIKLNADEPT